jgi:hypothetical protein
LPRLVAAALGPGGRRQKYRRHSLAIFGMLVAKASRLGEVAQFTASLIASSCKWREDDALP